MDPKTLEEARELLLQNSEQINQLTEQVNTLTAQNAEKDKSIEDLRVLNQKLFLRASQGEAEPEDTDDEPSQSLEDFAQTLKGVIK